MKFKHLWVTLTDQIYIHGEVKNRCNRWASARILSSILCSRVYNLACSFLWVWSWPVTFMEEHGLRFFATYTVLSSRPHCDSDRAPRNHVVSVFQGALFNDGVSCEDSRAQWRMNEYEASVEWRWLRKVGVIREEPVQVPFCTPQILHEVACGYTRAFAVRGWRLTACAIARRE